VVKTFLARNRDRGGLAVFVDEFQEACLGTDGHC
jgi:hypothetical protein